MNSSRTGYRSRVLDTNFRVRPFESGEIRDMVIGWLGKVEDHTRDLQDLSLGELCKIRDSYSVIADRLCLLLR